MKRILIAVLLGCLGAWAGSHLVYLQENPLYEYDPRNGTFMERTPDNAWRWWLGIFTGGFIGASVPFAGEPYRSYVKKKFRNKAHIDK